MHHDPRSPLALALAFASLGLLSAGCDPFEGGLRGSGEPLTETRTLEAADGFVNNTLVDVTVIEVEGEEASTVKLTCDDNLVTRLTTTVEDGTLVLDREGLSPFTNRTECVATVTLPALTLLTSAGSGDIEVVGAIADLPALRSSGSGDIVIAGHLDGAARLELRGSGDVHIGSASGCDVDIEVSGSGNLAVEDFTSCYLNADLSGSGDTTLAGSVGTADLGISGSGSLGSLGLVLDDAFIQVDGSGDVRVSVTNAVSVEVRGSGDVTIGANPEGRSVEIDGSGDVVFL